MTVHLHIYSSTEGWETCVNGACPMDENGHILGQPGATDADPEPTEETE